jgi:hypothetical protein
MAKGFLLPFLGRGRDLCVSSKPLFWTSSAHHMPERRAEGPKPRIPFLLVASIKIKPFNGYSPPAAQLDVHSAAIPLHHDITTSTYS